MEAAFARLKKIATIRTSIAAFAALGFGLFSARQPRRSLYLNDTLHVTNIAAPRLHPQPRRAGRRGAVPAIPSARYFDRTYRKDPAKALALVGRADPAVGAVHAAAVLDAQHRRGS